MENLKIYTKEITNLNKTLKGISEIACYTENGKYYLRFSLLKGWYYYGGEKRSFFTKEFTSKENANNYFKKASVGFTKVN